MITKPSRKAAFTALYVTNVKAGPERCEIPDPGQRHLYLVVQPSGSRGFAVRYRFRGKARKMTLPSGISLADARVAASEAMLKVSKGIDPASEEREQKRRAAEADETAFAAVAALYMKEAGSKLRSASGRESIIRRHLLPKLGGRQIDEIERDEVVRALDKVAITSGPRAADMALAVLSKIFNWHQTRTSRFRSPLVRGMTRLKQAERARDRILDDDEIRRVWDACGDARMGIAGACFRFLLLTGARRTEAAAMTYSEIGVEVVRNGKEVKLDVWRLPKERAKGREAITRPLSRAALDVLKGVPRIVGCDYVFSVNGRPVRLDSGNNTPKKRVDELSGVTGWVVHDLRRTARTLLGRIGVSFDIAEMALGHRPPGGIIRWTYDMHSYLPQKLDAFEALAREIDRIVGGPSESKVVKLRRKNERR
jgi:integrase